METYGKRATSSKGVNTPTQRGIGCSMDYTSPNVVVLCLGEKVLGLWRTGNRQTRLDLGGKL